MTTPIEIVATILFALAVIHTFSVAYFARLAEKRGKHSGLWHQLSEVEAVFGAWALILVIFFVAFNDHTALAKLFRTLPDAGASIIDPERNAGLNYLMSRDFTEPLFVFTIMVVAGSRPILEAVGRLVRFVSKALPFPRPMSMFVVILSVVPLAGSLITEPAAMTLAALLLRDEFFSKSSYTRFKYAVIGVLFVNISIGGVLTHFAAPPVLMVASTFGWDTMYMLTNFGWKAVGAVIVNMLFVTWLFRKYLVSGVFDTPSADPDKLDVKRVPAIIIWIHILFLGGVVFFSHDPVIFITLLLFFIGFTEAYNTYQDRLMIKESLLVGFFLAGLVTLGGLQQWWLQPLLGGLEPVVLFIGATAITAVTDNAALTYLGSLVEGTSEMWRYMLVAGAVTGGGLTVIANAPNPAGFSILKNTFEGGTISPKDLFVAALIPTLVAAAFFLIPELL